MLKAHFPHSAIGRPGLRRLQIYFVKEALFIMAVPLAEGVSVPSKQGSLMDFGFASHAAGDIRDASTSVLERNCNLNIKNPVDRFRKTHIICTLGKNSVFIQ